MDISHLYDKKKGSGNRSDFKYLTSVKKKNSSFIVDGFAPTTKINLFIENVNKKVESYEYDSEYYDPNYREGYFEYMVIFDYLCDTLGFYKNVYGNSGHDVFELKPKNIYNFSEKKLALSFSGLDYFTSDISKEVSINLFFPGNDYKWISVKCNRNVKDIKRSIDSLLKPYLVHKSVENLNASEKLENFDDIEVLLNKVSGFDLNKKSYKKQLKDKLLEMANAIES